MISRIPCGLRYSINSPPPNPASCSWAATAGSSTKHDRLAGLLDAPLSQQGITWTSPFLNPFMHTSVMFRTDVIRDQFGGYNEDYRIAQDYELWTRVIATHQGANLPQRLVCYRHLPTSLSKSEKNVAFAEAAQVSAREAKRIFGHDLSGRETGLVAAFREGLDPGNRQAFWQLYGNCSRIGIHEPVIFPAPWPCTI